jgi:hypothetical protein
MVDGDGQEHLVTHEAYEEGLREGSGIYQAVCGQRITVGGMTAPPSYRCHPCEVLEPRA